MLNNIQLYPRLESNREADVEDGLEVRAQGKTRQNCFSTKKIRITEEQVFTLLQPGQYRKRYRSS
jgi:hypothetical protein